MEIEKNIPLPAARCAANGGSRYPFAEMGVGDSIFVEGQDTTGPVAAAARVYAHRVKTKRFSARKVEGGVRIWRIE